MLYNPECTVINYPEGGPGDRVIFEQLTTVVSLTEQIRVTDPEWQGFLSHRQFVQAKEKHILDMLRHLASWH